VCFCYLPPASEADRVITKYLVSLSYNFKATAVTDVILIGLQVLETDVFFLNTVYRRASNCS